MTANILVIDDDPGVRESLGELLRSEGYQVDAASSGEEGLSAVKTSEYDLALLDIRLPGVDGEVVMEQIRKQRPNTNVIIISGYGSLESAILALRLGVKDYFIKPYAIEDLLDAICCVLQEKEEKTRKGILLEQLESSLEQLKDLEGIRTESLPARRVVNLPGGILVDLERREIWRGNERVSLTPTESNLLGIFLENRNRVLTHSELVFLVQGIRVDENEAPEILRPMISRLRKKFAAFPGTAGWVSNVRGTGYSFDPA